jgi:hypothetical protein
MRLLPWRRRERPVSRELTEARRQRAEAECRLAEAREHVIVPLRELREKNHVSEAISLIIQRRIERETPGNG